MIFVTVGTQKFQFNRLLRAVDDLIASSAIKESVFAQIGFSNYIPKYYRYKRFVDQEEYYAMEEKADIIITHGGTGAIIGAVKKEKKVIAVPRLCRYGEHVDDHQTQVIRQLTEMGMIYGCRDCTELKKALEQIRYIKFRYFQSNTQAIIDSIDQFICTL